MGFVDRKKTQNQQNQTPPAASNQINKQNKQ